MVVFLLIDLPFQSDVHLFQFWANRLFEDGLASFYYADFFSDYPPMYMYVLWVVGAINSVLGFEYLSRSFNLLIFSPAIIADLITVLFIYTLGIRMLSTKAAFGIALTYSINPGVILNSTIWGQVDAVHTLLLFFAIYAVSKKQILPVYLLYGVAVLTKPQSLIVAPIFLYSAFYYFKENGYTPKAALTMVGYAVCTFLFMAFLSLPFGLGLVLNQYVDTVGSRPFATINAYNFYALTGGNWHDITPFFAMLSATAIVGVSCVAFWLLHKHFNTAAVFYSAALLYIITFVFSARMNERYLFPALLFLLMSAMFMRNKSDDRIPILYAVFSSTFFINCLDILLRTYDIQFFGPPPPPVHRPVESFVALISFINVSFAFYSLKIGRDIQRWTDF